MMTCPNCGCTKEVVDYIPQVKYCITCQKPFSVNLSEGLVFNIIYPESKAINTVIE